MATQLGDITKIDWSKVQPVDVITGGSPCQSLSLAGTRKGFEGQSGLFLEQIRCVKELRYHALEQKSDNPRAIVPRFMVWENVPGAFSCSGGNDFRRILEEITRICEPDAPDLSVPEKGWPYCGAIVGDGFSIAWRTHDAQYWGVPQRRRRIALIADFGGFTAPEILFEPQGLQGDTGESEAQGQTVAGRSETNTAYAIQGNCIDRADTAGCNGKGWREGACFCLNTIDRPAVYALDRASYNQGQNAKFDSQITDNGVAPTLVSSGPSAVALDNHPQDSRLTIRENGIVQTLPGNMGTGGNNTPFVFNRQRTDAFSENKDGIASTQTARQYKDATDLVSIPFDGVRRITPLECERLQGFPDGWTDIGEWTGSRGRTRKSTDALRYKALGNSIAIPFWKWLLERIYNQLSEDGYPCTLGSLFDGIGGFPLCWPGETLWVSEIDEFCQAVERARL